MSVHKSLRRDAKNLYKSSVKELIEYVQDRSLALSENKTLQGYFQSDIMKFSSDVLSKLVIADANDITRNSDYIACEKEIEYLTDLRKSVSILFRYLSYMMNFMYDKNKWFRGKKYSIRMLQRFSELAVNSKDNIDMKIEYIKNLEEEKGLKNKQVYTFEMKEIYN